MKLVGYDLVILYRNIFEVICDDPTSPQGVLKSLATRLPNSRQDSLMHHKIYKIITATIRAITILTLNIYNRGHQMPIQSLNIAKESNLQNKTKQVCQRAKECSREQLTKFRQRLCLLQLPLSCSHPCKENKLMEWAFAQ